MCEMAAGPVLLRLSNPVKTMSGPWCGAGLHARSSLQLLGRLCHDKNAASALVCADSARCCRYKPLCPSCPQNPSKKPPGRSTKPEHLSKSVTRAEMDCRAAPGEVNPACSSTASSSSGNGCDRTAEQLVPTQTEGTSGPFSSIGPF